MILLFAALLLKWIGTNMSYNSFLASTSKTPGFILMYSPYCEHCQEIHPTWEELMDHFEGDLSIIVGEIDCTEYNKICNIMMEASGYPAFGSFVKGRGIPVSPDLTLSGFIEEAKTIKRSNLSVPCLQYPSDFLPKYPSFVYHARNGVHVICPIVHSIAKTVPASWSCIYSSGGDPSYEALISPNRSVSYSGQFDIHSLTDFTKDWIMSSLGDWQLAEGISTRRRFGFLVLTDIGGCQEFQSVVNEFMEHILIGKIKYRAFQSIYPDIRIQQPALIVANLQKSKFKIFNRVNLVTNLSRILNETIYGDHDSSAQLQLPLIFPSVPRNEKFDLWSKIFILLIILSIGAVAILVFLARLLVSSHASKKE